MPRFHCPVGHILGRCTALALAVSSWFGASAALGAEAPEWWGTWRAIGSAAASDYAALNHGQLKTLARAAMQEFDGRLAGGAGSAVHALVYGWLSGATDADGRDFAAVNLGQLKTVALPFYQRLGLTPPWTNAPFAASDYAMANIGQAKTLFGFDFSSDQDGDRIPDLAEIAAGSDPSVKTDIDGNGLADDWERFHFGVTGLDASALAARGDGRTIGQTYAQAAHPNDPNDGRPPPATPTITAKVNSGQFTNHAFAEYSASLAPARYLTEKQDAVETYELPALYPFRDQSRLKITVSVAPLTGEKTYSDGLSERHQTVSYTSPYLTQHDSTATYGTGTDFYIGWTGQQTSVYNINTEHEWSRTEPINTVPGVTRAGWLPVTSLTQLSGTHVFDFGWEVSGFMRLSQLYPTNSFISDAMDTLPLPDDWNDFPNWGEIFAWRYLYPGGGGFDAGVAVYRMEVPSLSLPHTVTWLEVFRPYDDPSTVNVDESNHPQITKREWKSAGSTLHSATYHLDPESIGINGEWFLLPVELEKVWSDQLPGVEANFLPYVVPNNPSSGLGTGNLDKPYIFMGACQSSNFDLKGHIKAKVKVPAEPALRNKILWRLAKKNGATYNPANGTSTYDANGEIVTITIDSPENGTNQPDHYHLVAGYDQDGNGQLSPTEANIVPRYKWKGQEYDYEVKLVSRDKYNSARNQLLNTASIWSFIYPQASKCLTGFLNEAVPNGATSEATTVDRREYGLSHPVGILFNSGAASTHGVPKAGPGASIRAIFAPNSPMSNKVAESDTLASFINGKLAPQADQIREEATRYFQLHPDEILAPFNYQLDTKSADGKEQGLAFLAADADLLLAIGKGTASITVDLYVNRTLQVHEVVLSGTVLDLYDFDYDATVVNSPPEAESAAEVQAGYNTLGVGGRVFKSKIQMLDRTVINPIYNFL
jgi:hypothetical protein